MQVMETQAGGNRISVLESSRNSFLFGTVSGNG
jgi:hypothetical protein